MMELRVAAPHLRTLHERMLAAAPAEAAAFLAVEPAGDRLVLRSAHVFSARDLDGDGHGELVLNEEAQIAALAQLKRRGHGLVEAHTHPGSAGPVTFSGYDEAQLPEFTRYVSRKLPGRPFGALVLGQRGYVGRALLPSACPLELRAAGQLTDIPTWLKWAPKVAAENTSERFDRQVRALGPAGQARLAALRVGVVGLGGTGSLVVQQLAHLGVRDLVLVEDDRVERSNLPRLVGATPLDALLRRPKTAVARRAVRRVVPRAIVRTTGPLRRLESLTALQAVDLIIGCVDNDGARLVLAELAAAYLVPYLDIGVGIEANGADALESVGGRVAFQLPGGACLACSDDLDLAEAAEDLETEALRRLRVARGYARDRAVEPALMPLNTTLVGLAMIELLAFCSGIRPVVPFLRHDALTTQTVVLNAAPDPECTVCGAASGMGDRQQVGRYALEAPRTRRTLSAAS